MSLGVNAAHTLARLDSEGCYLTVASPCPGELWVNRSHLCCASESLGAIPPRLPRLVDWEPRDYAAHPWRCYRCRDELLATTPTQSNIRLQIVKDRAD